ncbi:[FeFe] hydrogenase H-cluster radical SAM maturase HydE [Proteiniphilum sp. UBA1028]|jgi:biotin synthase|uniref:[FeFe] hydrogenase H-cluster radical SAM maturase HydE n=1 Tax=Proteiniphilum sp. UBA1028 TaxID=1947251 RepID=UPI000E80F442|nr:[FeFe] hydrogenase H-cluster radical SAM maturase HydE [Proteiniphilum sp. UBA1028]HBG56730.1 [FeFe] hydrogenase H-cluster radical SAM maturase HydE [Porphyromonadaceae bacterium]
MFETLQKNILSKEDIVTLLSLVGEEQQQLFEHAEKIKLHHVGNNVWLRGLIELSNICGKDCYYCGIRRSNSHIRRYILSHDDVMQAVKEAYEKGYGSVAVQSGEITSNDFIHKINKIVVDSKRMTHGEIGITLSCGEQTEETYRRWFESGADRYLLRIETSSEELYRRLHPNNEKHNYSKRVHALEALRKTGYQVGTGVMIGLPFQTNEMLADDLLFMKQSDIDMCGMGPYIEQASTPLYALRGQLSSLMERFCLSLKMVALLRILMPDINIAATTALQAIQRDGREQAIRAGANVLMPNITPKQYRGDYLLYDNKPVSVNSDGDELLLLEQRLKTIDHKIGYFLQGNSLHYRNLSK